MQKLDYVIADNSEIPHISIVDHEGTTVVSWPLPQNDEERSHLELLIIGAVSAANAAKTRQLYRLLTIAATHCMHRGWEMSHIHKAAHSTLIAAAVQAFKEPDVGAEYVSLDPKLDGTVVVTRVSHGQVDYTGAADGWAKVDAFWDGFASMTNSTEAVQCA